MRGIIKWFNEKKGYGFISGDDGTDYFLHISAVVETGLIIRPNDEVEFDVIKTHRGFQAKNLQIKNNPKNSNNQFNKTETHKKTYKKQKSYQRT